MLITVSRKVTEIIMVECSTITTSAFQTLVTDGDKAYVCGDLQSAFNLWLTAVEQLVKREDFWPLIARFERVAPPNFAWQALLSSLQKQGTHFCEYGSRLCQGLGDPVVSAAGDWNFFNHVIPQAIEYKWASDKELWHMALLALNHNSFFSDIISDNIVEDSFTTVNGFLQLVEDTPWLATLLVASPCTESKILLALQGVRNNVLEQEVEGILPLARANTIAIIAKQFRLRGYFPASSSDIMELVKKMMDNFDRLGDHSKAVVSCFLPPNDNPVEPGSQNFPISCTPVKSMKDLAQKEFPHCCLHFPATLPQRALFLWDNNTLELVQTAFAYPFLKFEVFNIPAQEKENLAVISQANQLKNISKLESNGIEVAEEKAYGVVFAATAMEYNPMGAEMLTVIYKKLANGGLAQTRWFMLSQRQRVRKLIDKKNSNYFGVEAPEANLTACAIRDLLEVPSLSQSLLALDGQWASSSRFIQKSINEVVNRTPVDYLGLCVFAEQTKFVSIPTQNIHLFNLTMQANYKGSPLAFLAACDMIGYLSCQYGVTQWFQKMPDKLPQITRLVEEKNFKDLEAAIKAANSSGGVGRLNAYLRMTNLLGSEISPKERSKIRTELKEIVRMGLKPEEVSPETGYQLACLGAAVYHGKFAEFTGRASMEAFQSFQNHFFALANGLNTMVCPSVNTYFVAYFSSLYREMGFLGQSVAMLQAAHSQAPHADDVTHTLAKYLSDVGKQKEAEECIDKCKEISSSDMMALSFAGCTDTQKLYKYHKKWADLERSRITKVFDHKDHDYTISSRPIRVGIISFDLKQHPVAFFAYPLLKFGCKSEIQYYCYYTASKADAFTEKMKKEAYAWRDVNSLTTLQLAELVKEDKIDILIDLTGHAGDTRLTTFIHKPAPIQATWLGYICTTGIDEIDYWITDRNCSGLGCVEPSAETKWYLDRPWACYSPLETAPPVDKREQAETTVTFGSFQNYGKMTPATLKLWAKVLVAVPNSRLVLKTRSLVDETEVSRFLKLFKEEGVSSDRLTLLIQTATLEEHMAAYNQVDIALDPVEMSGATTTCDCLWMGVPIITLEGAQYSARMSTSVLREVGMGDWVAKTEKQYVNLAREAAVRIDEVRKLREGIRVTMKNSRMTDGEDFSREFSRALKTMWRRKVVSLLGRKDK